jgi:iron complex transport system permease protein
VRPAAGIVLFLASAAMTLRPGGDPASLAMMAGFRLPRLLAAVMVGSGMGLAGWAIQRATRNPLASPDLLTVTPAAGLAVTVLLTFGSDSLLGSSTLPFAAAGAGVVSALLLVASAGRRRQGSGLLLSGAAAGGLIAAATYLVALQGPPSAFAQAAAWMTGSLGRASWGLLRLLYPVWWTLGSALLLAAPRIEALAFDEDSAASMGLRPDRDRRLALAGGAALAAACCGAAGAFGFLGFVAPPLAPRSGAAGAAAAGAVLLAAADASGQVLPGPTALPAGICVALVAGPAFLLLLLRRRKLGAA